MPFKTAPVTVQNSNLLTIMIPLNSPARVALDRLFDTGIAPSLTAKIGEVHENNLAIARQNTETVARQLIQNSLPFTFPDTWTADDLEQILNELMPEDL
jgi:hypothetical protein